MARNQGAEVTKDGRIVVCYGGFLPVSYETLMHPKTDETKQREIVAHHTVNREIALELITRDIQAFGARQEAKVG